MSTLLRAELLKQRTTRAVPVTLTVSLGLAMFILQQIVDGAGMRGAPSLGTLALTRQVVGIPVLATLPLLVLGVLSMAGEHRHRTLTATLLIQPHRGRLVLAKSGVAAAVAFTWAIIAIVVVNGAAIPLLARGGVNHLGVFTPSLWTALASIPLILALHAVMGVGIGALTGNQLVGALIPAAWLLVLEPNIIAPRLPGLARVLPGVASNIAGSTPHAPSLPFWFGLVVLALWALGLLLLGVWAMRRRDL